MVTARRIDLVFPRFKLLSGAERLILELAGALARKGHRPRIVCHRFDESCRPLLQPGVALAESGVRLDWSANRYQNAVFDYLRVGVLIGLFNESILAERGFGPTVYYQTLVVTALTALIGNFAGGWLAERWSMPRLMAVAMGVLATGLAVLPHLATVLQVMGWAVLMGVGGGFVMVLFFGYWARAYGRRDLGQIQGVAQALTVVASAVGPLLLAQWVARTGSYGSMFTLLAGVVALNAFAALAIRMPEPAEAPGVLVRESA